MSGEMPRKGGWKAPDGLASRNRFANFASTLASTRHAHHDVARDDGLFR